MEGASGPAPFPLPPPDVIRETANEVIQRREFKLDGTEYDFSTSLLHRLLELLAWLLRPFARALGALHETSPFLYWLVILLLLLIAVGLIAHIIYTFWLALQKRRGAGLGVAAEERQANLPETWERKAHAAALSGDYIAAVRYLFHACLLRLEGAKKRTVRRGATNREYLRRYAETPAFEPMRLFVATIDVKWYGGATCSMDDYRQCADAHVQIRRLAEEIVNAHGT